jgi:hypothetical protein
VTFGGNQKEYEKAFQQCLEFKMDVALKSVVP